MQRRTLKRLFFSGTLLVLTLPIYARAEDATADLPKIQVSRRDGTMYVENADAPNPPVTSVGASQDATTQALDARMPANIQEHVLKISKNQGVDPQLVAAVMKVESNYNVWAHSSKGALGLMQLIPATGLRFGVSNFFDAEENITGGVKYLRFLTDKFGASRLDLILAAYNAGENLVGRLNAVPAIPETRDYVKKITKIYQPSGSPALVSASENIKPVIETVAPEPTNKIYRSVDARGVIHFSNIGPPN